MFYLIGVVLERQLLHLCPCMERNEEEDRSLDTVLAARDAGVVHTMTALIRVELCLAGLPAR